VIGRPASKLEQLLEQLARNRLGRERLVSAPPADRLLDVHRLRTVAVSCFRLGGVRSGALRRFPAAKLLAIGEVVMLAREHLSRLEPHERRRVIALMRRGRGRSSRLSASEQAELAALIAKANPRLFAGMVAEKLSPVPLPKWLVRGRRPASR